MKQNLQLIIVAVLKSYREAAWSSVLTIIVQEMATYYDINHLGWPVFDHSSVVFIGVSITI